MKLTQDQIRAVQLATVKYVEIARTRFNKQFPMPVVRFDLRGTVGGIALLKENVIRVNQTLCAENFEHYLKQVIGHEVAHIIAHALYPFKRIKPHGYEWQNVMHAFGLQADRCHTYDVSNARARNVERIKYSCNCRVFDMSKTLHNKMLLGQKRFCKSCRGQLKIGESIGGSPLMVRQVRNRVTLSSLLNQANLYRSLGLPE